MYRHVNANSIDPDQMPQNVASDQGLHFSMHATHSAALAITPGSQCLNFMASMVSS